MNKTKKITCTAQQLAHSPLFVRRWIEKNPWWGSHCYSTVFYSWMKESNSFSSECLLLNFPWCSVIKNLCVQEEGRGERGEEWTWRNVKTFSDTWKIRQEKCNMNHGFRTSNEVNMAHTEIPLTYWEYYWIEYHNSVTFASPIIRDFGYTFFIWRIKNSEFAIFTAKSLIIQSCKYAIWPLTLCHFQEKVKKQALD